VNNIVTELPIGSGQARIAWRAIDDDVDEHDELEAGGPAPIGPPAPAVEVAAPSVEIVRWEPRKLRQPLKLMGKTVNWQVRRRTGVDTTAGLMTEENLEDIGEPMAEVFNRYEPTRALAARSAELNLALAVWDYAHETAHKAARDQLLAREGEEHARRAPEREALAHLAPVVERTYEEGDDL
jgi:hypothetical protein